MRQSKPTLEQDRAQHAWSAIQKAVRLGNDDKKKYGTEVKQLPVRILAAGLGHSLAFLSAKGEPGHTALLKDLSEWVCQRLAGKVKGDLLQSIVQGDSIFLRRATDESLSYLRWLVRFAEAEGLTDEES
jgi:CRISPR type III-B/RAMP module-associated protein Cmr5